LEPNTDNYLKLTSKTNDLIAAFEDQLRYLVDSPLNKRFLVACSGGMDSTLLAHLCKRIGLKFDICHVNYHLRGKESDGDEDFVSDLATQLEVELYLLDCDTSDIGKNTQLAARTIRYEWFDSLIHEKGYDFLMTAHHLNDSVETLLFNLSRGTGIAGLTGIPERNEYIIRPLLSFSQEDLTQYVESEKLEYRTDSTNLKDKYARNFLRHHVVPALQKQNPNFLEGTVKTINHLKCTAYYSALAMDIILATDMETEALNRYKLPVATIVDQVYPSAVAYHWLSPYGFTSGQIEDFIGKEKWNNGASIIAGKWRLGYDRAHFILYQDHVYGTKRITFNPRLIRQVNFNGQRYDFDFLVTPEQSLDHEDGSAYFDASKIDLLSLRYRNEGDVFFPFGMNGKAKKLKKFFIDEKMDSHQKAATQLLLNKDAIMWVVGRRKDHHHRVLKSSNEILKVTASKP